MGRTMLETAGVRRSLRSVACCLFFAAGASALPAHAGLFDDEEARKRVAEQAKRIDDLQSQAQKQSQDVNARLGKLEETMKSQALLDLLTQIETLKQELGKLRGQMEVLGNSLDNTTKRQKDMYTDIDSRLRRLEQPLAPAGAVPPGPAAPAGAAAPPGDSPVGAPAQAGAAGPGATAAAPAAAVAPASGAQVAAAATGGDAMAESRAYESAQNLRRIGNYQGAIAAFQNFVKQYPKSGLAPSAQYWIGDSYYNMRDFKSAIASQQQLLKTYPDSPKVPDALLNIASAQHEMGDAAAARKTMQDLVSRYPVSDAADKAKRRLATLK